MRWNLKTVTYCKFTAESDGQQCSGSRLRHSVLCNTFIQTKQDYKKYSSLWVVQNAASLWVVQNKSLVQLLCPSHVIRPRYCASDGRDEALETRPEVDHFKRVIEPAGRDAEVRVMWRDVVHAVMASRQQNVQRLQEHDRTRQTKVRVRPLVYLSRTRTIPAPLS